MAAILQDPRAVERPEQNVGLVTAQRSGLRVLPALLAAGLPSGSNQPGPAAR